MRLTSAGHLWYFSLRGERRCMAKKSPQQRAKPKENVVGENILHLLEKKGQERGRRVPINEFARALEVSRNTAYGWVRGETIPHGVHRQKICDYFGITEAQLFSKGLAVGTPTGEEEAAHRLIVKLGLKRVSPDDLTRLSEEDKDLIVDLIHRLAKERSQQRQKMQAVATGITPGSSNDHRKRILIIEDEPRLCRSMQVKLREIGYRAFTAGEGNEGLRQIERHKPDLILVDMHMASGMGGEEFLQKLRQTDQKTKVIIISAFPGEVANVWTKELRFEEHVEKPFDLEFLLERIEKAIGGPT